jgi:hypothetical protein
MASRAGGPRDEEHDRAEYEANATFESPSRSLPFPCALDDCDVTINRELGDALDLAAGLGPIDLQPVEFRSFPNARTDRST